MTPAALADGLTSVAYLSRIEANERRPSQPLLTDLAQRLRVNPAGLTRGGTPAVEGLRFELVHADFLLASGHFGDAAQVGADLAEVATCLGSLRVAEAAKVVHASALAADGQPRAALGVLGPPAGPTGLPALVATARCHVALSDYAAAITVARQAADQVSAAHRLSAPEGADLAVTLCAALWATDRHSTAVQVAHRALQQMPDLAGTKDLAPRSTGAAPYRSLGQLNHSTERAVAALQLSTLMADVERLRGYTFPGGTPEAVSLVTTARMAGQ